MDHHPVTSSLPRDAEPLGLAAAYVQFQDLMLKRPEVGDYLFSVSVLAAAVVPGTHCGITLRRGLVNTTTGNDSVAAHLEEVQRRLGRGPCLEAMRTETRVEVLDQATDTRWGPYATEALDQGIRSSVSLPLTAGGETLGALNLFATNPHSFSEADVVRAQAFTEQAASSLTILRRLAGRVALDTQLDEALASRATIDQALGILMVTRKISARDALQHLRQASQDSNRKVSLIASDLIRSETGHAPEAPRPLSERD